ncbi:hypothetical protein BHM03_00032994 [Ensete ventricosum]|nr:hypothetical protein BHM03_00032994 [Ensete ventricosum]
MPRCQNARDAIGGGGGRRGGCCQLGGCKDEGSEEEEEKVWERVAVGRGGCLCRLGCCGGCSEAKRSEAKQMCPAFKLAERAFAGSGPCALVRPSRGLLGTERELVWMSGGSELDLGGMLLEWWGPSEEGVVQLRSAAGFCKKVGSGVRLRLGGADLTCVMSTVRALALPVHPVGYLRRVGHVSGTAIRGCDDLAARSAFVISLSLPISPEGSQSVRLLFPTHSTRLDSARLYPALGFEIGPTSMETPQKRKPRDAADDEEAEAIKKRRLSDGEGEEDDGSGSLPGLAVYKDEDDEDEEAMVRRERGDDGSNGLGGGRGEPVDNGDHRVGGGGDEEMQEVEDKAAARIPAPVRQQRQVERRRDCPYLDTVNRQKYCSYNQGLTYRSVSVYRVYLGTGRYTQCEEKRSLPTGCDGAWALATRGRFSKEQVLHLDENRQWSRALDGSNYLPGMGELEVVKEIQTKLLIEKKDNDEEQYNVTVAEGGSSIDNVVREASRVPFLMLGLDLPPPPLFKDAMEKNIIPQVRIIDVSS